MSDETEMTSTETRSLLRSYEATISFVWPPFDDPVCHAEGSWRTSLICNVTPSGALDVLAVLMVAMPYLVDVTVSP